MTDNKPLENQAEYFIMSCLINHGFFVSKPSFDQMGADLLVIDSLSNRKANFLKVQSKGRSVTTEKPSSVTIPIDYVDGSFVLFLYVVDENYQNELYTFVASDFEHWNKRDKEYSLTLSVKSLSQLKQYLFNTEKVKHIRYLLTIQPEKRYTSIIIDGIFLQRAIRETKSFYWNIYPDKSFKKPTLEEVVHQLLQFYNRFQDSNTYINAVVYTSVHHNLDFFVEMPEQLAFKSSTSSEFRLQIHASKDIISFEVCDQLDRIINSENVILVANDIAYEAPINELLKNGIEVILLTLQEELGREIFAKCKWGDILYPLGVALGLERHEL